MAEMMFARRSTMNRESDVSKERFNQTISELSDDSDIEILTPDDIEESTFSWSENNLKITEESDQKEDLETGEDTRDDPSADIEIISLSSDDEETSNSKDDALENKTYSYASESSESSDDQIEIEIETDNEKINIKRNSHLNLDELFLGSDEEYVMFDFSNYSADDVLRAVENNKLFNDDQTPNVNVKKIENSINSKSDRNENEVKKIEKFEKPKADRDECEVKKIQNFVKSKTDRNECKVSSEGIKADLDKDNEITARNNNVNKKTSFAEIGNNNEQLPYFASESIDSKISNDVISEMQLILKCRKCFAPGIAEINTNINNSEKREKCPRCLYNMSFQCKICTCLFHSIFSFTNHLKNFHMRESERILKSIDNLQLINNRKRRTQKDGEKRKRGRPKKSGNEVKTILQASKVQKVQKVKKKEKKRVIYRCANCSQMCQSLQHLRMHRLSCDIIPYLYCRLCPINVESMKELRDHMIHHHSQVINPSDLNQILHGIEQEGHKIIAMKSILQVTCVVCKSMHELNHRDMRCGQCRSSLMFKCGDADCDVLFRALPELIRHVRQRHLHSWHRCDLCGAASAECADAARHRLLHPECRVTYRHCPDCHYEASSPGDLSSHVYCAHREPPAAERLASRPYTGPYACHACGRVFKLEHRLRRHQSNFCRKTCRTYDCAHCRYTSFDKAKLLQHLRCSHVGVFTGRNLSCHKCGVEVASIFKLNSHIGRCKAKTWRWSAAPAADPAAMRRVL